MADSARQLSLDERLAETVRSYRILYDKSLKDFKDKAKKTLAWEEVAKKMGFSSGKDAETSFKNLRNRYSRDKKKVKAAKVSGTDSDSVSDGTQKTSELYSYLAWLDPYVHPCASASNLVEQDNSVDPESHSDESKSEISYSGITSKVTGRVKCTKRGRPFVNENPVDAAEIKIIKSLGDHLDQKQKSQEKDEDVIFGELMASQLKRIPPDERTVTKMEINNVMYSHLLKSNSYNQSKQAQAFSAGNFANNAINQFQPTPSTGNQSFAEQEQLGSFFMNEVPNSQFFSPGHSFHQREKNV